MTYPKDPRVDAYIDALPEWQRDVCRQVRDLVHGCDPEVVETIKRTRQPYFVLQGNVCALLLVHQVDRHVQAQRAHGLIDSDSQPVRLNQLGQPK